MGHDAKVSLKHYAQTTEEHFDRAAGGAKSGASEAQNPAQQADAGYGSESQELSTSPDLVGSSAIPCETQPFAAEGPNGEGGIRTRGGPYGPHRFSKPALSAAQPPLLGSLASSAKSRASVFYGRVIWSQAVRRILRNAPPGRDLPSLTTLLALQSRDREGAVDSPKNSLPYGRGSDVQVFSLAIGAGRG